MTDPSWLSSAPIRLEKRTVLTAAWSLVVFSESMFRLRLWNGVTAVRNAAEQHQTLFVKRLRLFSIVSEPRPYHANSYLKLKWSFQIKTTKSCDMSYSLVKRPEFVVRNVRRHSNFTTTMKFSEPLCHWNWWFLYYLRKKPKIVFFHFNQNSHSCLLQMGVKHRMKEATCSRFATSQLTNGSWSQHIYFSS